MKIFYRRYAKLLYFVMISNIIKHPVHYFNGSVVIAQLYPLRRRMRYFNNFHLHLCAWFLWIWETYSWFISNGTPVEQSKYFRKRIFFPCFRGIPGCLFTRTSLLKSSNNLELICNDVNIKFSWLVIYRVISVTSTLFYDRHILQVWTSQTWN